MKWKYVTILSQMWRISGDADHSEYCAPVLYVHTIHTKYVLIHTSRHAPSPDDKSWKRATTYVIKDQAVRFLNGCCGKVNRLFKLSNHVRSHEYTYGYGDGVHTYVHLLMIADSWDFVEHVLHVFEGEE